MKVKITTITEQEKKEQLAKGDYNNILKIFTPQTYQLVVISKME